MLLYEIESINYVNKKRSLFYDILRNWNNNYYENNFTIDGKVGNFEIRSMRTQDKTYYFALYDTKTKKYATLVELYPFGKSKIATILQIDRVGVADAYQGMNLATKLYSWMILHKNIILVSGTSQSLGGRSIWENLAKVPGIFMFGYNSMTKKSFQIDQKDIYNEDMYSSELQAERDELQEQYTEIEKQQEKIKYNSFVWKSLESKLSALDDQIVKLDKDINNTTSIRLVAIKKH